MSTASQGNPIPLTANFYQPGTQVPTDPSSLQFQILFEDPNNPATPTIAAGPFMLSGLTRTGVGQYQYIWFVPPTQALGTYQVQWVGIVGGVPQFNMNELTIVAPSASTQTTVSAVALSNDPHVQVTPTSIYVKFDFTPKVSSILNASYHLFRVQGSSYVSIDYDSIIDYDQDTYNDSFTFSGDPGASNIFVSSPFNTIQQSDYNSISRILTLNFSSQLVPNAQYMLQISGLTNVAGLGIEDLQYLFSVPPNVSPSVAPIESPILIEDHSVAQTPYTSLDIISQLNPSFFVASTDPDENLVFIDPAYNNGRITVTFNVNPASMYINTTYFVLQSKPLSRGFNRWTTVTGTHVTLDPNVPNVYVDVPSTDATPVYNQSGTTYYQENYKYRLTVKQAVCADPTVAYNNLEADQVVGFFVDPSPFLVDTDIIQAYFPEASLFEIADLIFNASQEIQDVFDDGIYTQPITPTILSTLQDYVIAEVCCNLSRIYELGNGANQVAVTLGDLSVTQNNPSKAALVNRSNATTWCELAGVIRDEVYNLSSKSGMKAVVKGSRFRNPMPRRPVETQEWRNWGWDKDSNWRRDWN